MIQLLRKTKQGFSIIETIVAIAILTLVLTGATSLVNLSLRTITTFRNELTANMLAQEGAELVRWKRDSNRINFRTQSNRWMWDILQSGGAPCNMSDCIAEVNTTTGDISFSRCNAGPCPPLRFNPTTGIFSYETSGTIVTPFVRTIQVVDLSPASPPSAQDREVRVDVTVTWQSRFSGITKTVHAKEILLNWQ